MISTGLSGVGFGAWGILQDALLEVLERVHLALILRRRAERDPMCETGQLLLFDNAWFEVDDRSLKRRAGEGGAKPLAHRQPPRLSLRNRD